MTLTDTQVRGVIDRYTRGQGIAYIAFATDIPKSQVKQALIDSGIKVRKAGRPPLGLFARRAHG